jgi:hypothetical protein
MWISTKPRNVLIERNIAIVDEIHAMYRATVTNMQTFDECDQDQIKIETRNLLSQFDEQLTEEQLEMCDKQIILEIFKAYPKPSWKKLYRQAALAWHPDKYRSKEACFKVLTEVNAFLERAEIKRGQTQNQKPSIVGNPTILFALHGESGSV